MTYTQILPQYPGYTWIWDDALQSYWLHWSPIPGIYSPPSLHSGLHCVFQQVPEDLRSEMGRVIGKDGYFIKNITHRSQTVYIFFRNDVFEVWGDDISCRYALHLLQKHFSYHLRRVSSERKMGRLGLEPLEEVGFKPVQIGPVV